MSSKSLSYPLATENIAKEEVVGINYHCGHTVAIYAQAVPPHMRPAYSFL